jgi:hypothetical protein
MPENRLLAGVRVQNRAAAMDPSAALARIGQLHLDEPVLVGIINETENALVQIRNLNTTVSSLAGVVGQNSQSDAGQIMQRKLEIWSADFYTVEGNLVALNGRAQYLRRVLVAANAAARDAAAQQGGVAPTPTTTYLSRVAYRSINPNA